MPSGVYLSRGLASSGMRDRSEGCAEHNSGKTRPAGTAQWQVAVGRYLLSNTGEGLIVGARPGLP